MIEPREISIEREALLREMEEFYERLTGSDCEARIFCVLKTSMRGCYYVHRLNSSDFYEVNIRR